VNIPIARLLVLLLALFATVVGFTSYWSVIDAENLRENPENRRLLLEEAQIARGEIRSADGELIAESVQTGKGERKFYERRYPLGDLFGHPVGYYFLDRGRSGIELSHDDELTGREAEFISIIEQLEGQSREGSDITLTLNAEVQRTAYEALGGQVGAVVAIEPATGAVRVMASNPSFDPAGVQEDETYKALNAAEDAPLLNRGTQSGYEPGSAMKIVTATAALDSGEFTPDSVLNGDTGISISGVPLENSGGESFGEIDMTTALTNSVNTYWAQVGEQLGTETMFEYMDRFGFNDDPPLDYPPGELNPSGVYEGGRLLTDEDSIDVGRMAIGQERLLVTPLQMAMVAGAVANGGKLVEPTFLQSVTDPDGRTTDELQGEVDSTVMSEETAATLTELMTNVTQEGTAAGLTVPGAPEFAGKTGTAEVDIEAGINRGWFIGFAPTQDPQVAVAAVIERTSGFGGETAGPVATEVMGALLGQ
jgi:peptidoglycan glycosyltransferase